MGRQVLFNPCDMKRLIPLLGLLILLSACGGQDVVVEDDSLLEGILADPDAEEEEVIEDEVFEEVVPRPSEPTYPPNIE